MVMHLYFFPIGKAMKINRFVSAYLTQVAKPVGSTLNIQNSFPHKSQKAKAVSDLIDAVGEVTEDSENAITKAERAYEKLSATEKLSVNNYDKLVKARKALNRIQKEKQGVE